MRPLRVLYDGWPLLRQPAGPAALHLRTLLALAPDGVEAIVALPGEPPPGLGKIAFHVLPTPEAPRHRLAWEQRHLPRLARTLGAHLLHTTSPRPPLFGRPLSVVSPAEFVEPENSTAFESESIARGLPLAERLRAAMGRGGLARARAIFWPADLPRPNLPAPLIPLPPAVHPDFAPAPAAAPPSHLELQPPPAQGGAAVVRASAGEPPAWPLPESYVLYHGPPDEPCLLRLLEAWSWAAGPIGASCPLLVLGVDEAARPALAGLLGRFDLGDSVQAVPELSPEAIPRLYQGCTALFHPAPLVPWGNALRHALACGKPVVAAESELAGALVGPAAYLAPAGEPRALGAALITVVVEEEVANRLSQAARQRAAAWDAAGFGQALLSAYWEVLYGDRFGQNGPGAGEDPASGQPPR